VSSHNTNQLATAAFRDFGVVSTAGTNGPLELEPLGQSSRRTSLVISEVMYHPADTQGTIHTNALGFVTNSLEYVELLNTRGEFQDLAGFHHPIDSNPELRFYARFVASPTVTWAAEVNINHCNPNDQQA